MKDEDVKIGMRVIPHSKIGNTNFHETVVFTRSKLMNQNYLFVTGIVEDLSSNCGKIYLLNEVKNIVTGDYYVASDFEPDIKTERKEKLKKICLK